MPGSQPIHIYLSPHLDDAVLSCGGMIHKQARAGERAVVVTLCAGDPPSSALSEFAQELHARWAEDSAPPPLPARMTADRRAEDLAALDRLGAEAIHFTLPDAIYRTDPATARPLYASEKALFGDLHSSEQALVRRTAQKLSDLLRGMPRHRLHVPLTLGHHVDHQLTRLIAEQVGDTYAYYEDYPYAAALNRTGLAESPVTRTPLGRGMALGVVPLSDEDLQAKVQAVGVYASQISSFWRDVAAMEAALREFAALVGGEGLWRPV